MQLFFPVFLILIVYYDLIFAQFPKIIISEILRDPFGSEEKLGGGLSNEFVELTNLSQDTVSLDSLMISDGSEADKVIPWKEIIPGYEQCIFNQNYILPGQVALLLDPDYRSAIEADLSCKFTIHPGTVILTVDDNDIGNGLQADDGLILYKGSESKITSLLFSASDELWNSNSPPASKIKLSDPPDKEGTSVVLSSYVNRIAYSLCPTKISPGLFESLDNQWYTEWKVEGIDTSQCYVKCTVTCVFAGITKQQSLAWSIFSDTEILKSGNTQIMQGTAEFSFQLKKCAIGNIYLQVDNKFRKLVDAVISNNVNVRIEEIFPNAKSGESEWFELKNVSHDASVNIQHWRFGNSDNSVEITPDKVIISPNEYLVVCKDSSVMNRKYHGIAKLVQPSLWHTMNNYKDTLILWSSEGITRDLITYDNKLIPGWDDQSLERIDDTSTQLLQWRIAQISSPGTPTRSRQNNNQKVVIGPIPFTPNNDGKNDLLMIAIPVDNGKSATLSIIGFDGKKLKTVAVNASTTYYWDGKKDDGSAAPIGPFYVVVEETSSEGKTIFKNKGILWR